jgi:hypothetical protein
MHKKNKFQVLKCKHRLINGQWTLDGQYMTQLSILELYLWRYLLGCELYFYLKKFYILQRA